MDGTIPLGSSQHGIKDETFAYVENEATTKTSFSSTDASVSVPKSNKETKKRKTKYSNIVSEKLRSIRVGMDAVVATFIEATFKIIQKINCLKRLLRLEA